MEVLTRSMSSADTSGQRVCATENAARHALAHSSTDRSGETTRAATTSCIKTAASSSKSLICASRAAIRSSDMDQGYLESFDRAYCGHGLSERDYAQLRDIEARQQTITEALGVRRRPTQRAPGCPITLRRARAD